MANRTLTDQELRDEVIAGGWTGNDRLIAFAVSLAESDGNPDIMNRNYTVPGDPSTPIKSVDQGLFQINDFHRSAPGYDQVWATTKLGGYPGNAKLAYAIWKAAGGNDKAWSTQWNSYRDRATIERWAEYEARARAVFAGTAPLPYPLNAQTQVFGRSQDGPLWNNYQVVSTDPRVKLLQAALKIYQSGTFDGLTRTAVLAFQNKPGSGLTPHGIVGPAMWAALKVVG